MMEWVDTTAYSRGERGKIEPRCWRWEGNTLYISIIRRYEDDPDLWTITSNMGIYYQPLPAKTKEDAQKLAIEYVKERLDRMKNELLFEG